MKRVIALLLLVYPLQSNAQTKMREWVSNGVTYKLTQIIVNGNVTDSYKLYAGTLLIREYSTLNGKVIGAFREFGGDGKLLKETNFAQGEQKNGVEKTFHTNGKLESEVTYSNNQKHGIERFYSSEGVDLGGGAYRNGMQHGPWKILYENGNTMYTANYAEGRKEGNYEEYYENGKLRVAGRFENDNKDGEWIENHSNGELACKAVFNKGRLNGRVKQYNKDGKLMQDALYKDDRVKILRQYHKNGKLAFEYRAGDAYVYNFDDSGRLVEKEDADQWVAQHNEE